MKITALGHYVPKRVVGLEETLDLFRHYSRPLHDAASLEQMVNRIHGYLEKTAFKQITVRAPDEPWLENYVEMTRALLRESGVGLDEIDKVIYIGVARGYREPATAHQLASYIGIQHAECFDILDACASWSRAAHLIEPHFIAKRCQNVLVLSLEFNRGAVLGNAPNKEGGERFYRIASSDDLNWAAWGCTVGEAGTATLLSRDDQADPWFFKFDFDSDFHKYCGYTLNNHQEFDLAPNLLEKTISGTERFYAFAKEIGQSINDHFSKAFETPAVKRLLDEAKVVIPHSVSIPPYQKLFRKFGVEHKARYSFAEHGNTASCGIPLALSKSVHAGDVRRGDRVVLTPSGSGASYGVVSFRY